MYALHGRNVSIGVKEVSVPGLDRSCFMRILKLTYARNFLEENRV
jgi:hypothetical protein